MRRPKIAAVLVAGIITSLCAGAFAYAITGDLGPLLSDWRQNEALMETVKSVERLWLLATGRLVDLGGYRLRIDCTGAGSPVVVLEAGLYHSGRVWRDVQEEASTFTRVCSYDRAGVGNSDYSPLPRTAATAAGELAALLDKAGVAGPYILVGHSFGGHIVRLFAARWPEKVAGLVLVDASHEDQYQRFAQLMPPAEREEFLRHEGGANAEHMDVLASGEQVRRAGPLKAIPVFVLSSDEAMAGADKEVQGIQRVHRQLQEDLVRRIPGARRMTADRYGHFLQNQRPYLVVDAIDALVKETRATRKSE